MKIDLVGEKDRGFAMGLNESAGYIAVASSAFITGWIAGNYGMRPYPFYIGIVLCIVGLAMSGLLIRDTKRHVKLESGSSAVPLFKNIFWQTTWKHRNLGAITQAGFVNNLNDGMVWGLLPLVLAAKGFNLTDIGVIVAIYPAVWGIGQLITGGLADKYCKRNLLYLGMLVQGLALVAMVSTNSFLAFCLLSALLGMGTAIVYPTFLAAVSENTHPEQRPQSIGVFRFWRDLGYPFGAISTGLIADRYGLVAPVLIIGIVTILSGVVLKYRMGCASEIDATRNYETLTTQ